MENMFSKMSRSVAGMKSAAQKFYDASSDNHKALMQTALVMVLVAVPELALAQSTVPAGAGSNFFCYIAQYFKAICGTAALVAITMWAIEHIFGAAKLHDVVIKVGISAAIVICGSTLIANSGLSSTCAI